MNVIPFKRERTLAHVLLDIGIAGPIAWKYDGLDSLTDDEAGEALDRLDELQREARAMIETLTGVSWDAIQDAAL